MPVGPGSRLGPYEIQSAIGAGGMGEVYRALDTSLGRYVAIKVLPDSFATDADRLARFEREAKTLAALNHPHIAQIYGLERSSGTPALVMEFVEGATLADRIGRGPIPLGEALPIAREICDALEAAHDRGIVHRDLKPANIKLTGDGAVKVLDFGLAKLNDPDEHGPNAFSISPTLTSPAMTAVGVLLGTAAYMSPEQARGKVIDKRTDIWAFGCVLFEMLTGRRAFQGDEIADVLARVIERDPDFAALPPATPHAVRRLLRRALEKDRRKRLDSAAAARLELDEALAEPGETQPPMAVSNRRRRTGLWIAAAIVLTAMGALLGGGAVALRDSGDTPTTPVRFTVTLPDGWELSPISAPPSGSPPNPLAISPDGRTLAFVGRSPTNTYQIWLRTLAALNPRPLEGTEGAASPFWSPDGTSIAFFAGGKLKKIAVAGGPPITLADAPNERGGAWSRDGVILFAPTQTSPLMRVSAAGGVPTAVTKLADGETGHIRPVFLPDARHFLFRALPGAPQAQIFAASLDSPAARRVLESPSNVQYAARHLFFVRDTNLLAQPFDAESFAATGEAFPIAEQIRTSTGVPPNTGVFTVSAGGALVYQSGGGRATQLLWFDRTGKQLGALGNPGPYTDVELSPDGTQASVSVAGQGDTARDLWLFDVTRGLRTRFTFESSDERVLIWSPDRTRVAFNSNRMGHLDLYAKAANGSGTEEQLLVDGFDKYPISWGPDGQHLVYVRTGGATGNDLFILPLTGDRTPIPLAATGFSEAPGQFSPDGRWIAYRSDESGQNEIYVTAFPLRGGKWQVSNSGGDFPRWSGNGSEIIYVAPDNTLMAADVNGAGPNFTIGAVKALFRPRLVTTRYEYAVSRDGQRILVNTLPQETAAQPLTVVLNWNAALAK